MENCSNLDVKTSNDSDAISLFFEGDSIISSGELKKNSQSSLDEYLARPTELIEGLRQYPTEERINEMLNIMQNPTTTTELISLIPHLCGDLAANDRKNDINRVIGMANDMPRDLAKTVYESMFQALLKKECIYSVALLKMIDIVDQTCASEKWIDFIARKIVHKDNDDLNAFLNELERIAQFGYMFDDITSINRLMLHCIEKFNFRFVDFVLRKIINKLPQDQLDQVNEEILQKFVKARLGYETHQRMGLSKIRR